MILGYAAVYFTMAMIGERLAFPAIAKSIAASGMAWRRIRRRSAGYVDLEQGDVSGSLVHYGTAPRLRKNGKPTRKLYKVVLDDMAVIN